MQHFELLGRSNCLDLTDIRIRFEDPGYVLHVSAAKRSASSRTCHLGYGRSCEWMVLQYRFTCQTKGCLLTFTNFSRATLPKAYATGS